jgi:hypothetical protein
MSIPQGKYGPDKRVVWRLRNFAKAFATEFKRSDADGKAAAAYGYQWLREQRIPPEAWAMALSQNDFGRGPEVTFREWFQQAVVIVRKVLSAPGPLTLPPVHIHPPREALTEEPVGDPNLLEAIERVKHKVPSEHYNLVLRVTSRHERDETMDEIARDYEMDLGALRELYDRILRALLSPYTFR